MCRSIKTLRRKDEPPTEQEIEEAALQFVRKLSGYRKPARHNEQVFESAVDEVAAATRRLLDGLTTGKSARAAS
ncbi:MAG TPA: DUF2277 domain-containing protein [Dehalococcoidia bacterium]|nr:DUF2277 domain-containing protein [Dehalococcoidia bacterium]